MAKSSLPLKQTHGARLEENNTVADLLNKHKKQSQKSVSEYAKVISAMTIDELHRHAVEAGEVPIEDTNKLLDRLQKRFARTLGKNVTAKEFDVIE